MAVIVVLVYAKLWTKNENIMLNKRLVRTEHIGYGSFCGGCKQQPEQERKDTV